MHEYHYILILTLWMAGHIPSYWKICQTTTPTSGTQSTWAPGRPQLLLSTRVNMVIILFNVTVHTMYEKDPFRFAIHLDIPLCYTAITVRTHEIPPITQPACRRQYLQINAHIYRHIQLTHSRELWLTASDSRRWGADIYHNPILKLTLYKSFIAKYGILWKYQQCLKQKE